MKLRIAVSCLLGIMLGGISLGLVAKANIPDEDEPRDFCPWYCGQYYSEGSLPYNTCVASCKHGAEVCRSQSQAGCITCCSNFCAGDTTGICYSNCVHHARECYQTPETPN